MDVCPPMSANLLSLLLFSLIFQPFISSASSSYPPAKLQPYDRRVLLRIQKHFGGPKSHFWNSSDPNCCVHCDVPVSCDEDGHVERLYLTSGPNLSGPIPSAIGDLIFLADLSITGPGFTGRIPSSFGNLINLQYLVINNTHVTGPIPRSLGRLKNVRTLQLSYSKLSGPVPDSLGNLTNVDQLDLSSNKLSGPIPDFLVKLTNLGQLDLSSNRLSGPIPDFLGQTGVGQLDLSSNRLSGPIPDSLGNLTDLEELILHSNRLSGRIPAFVGQLVFSDYISLHSNQLSGEIPEGIWSSYDQFDLLLNNNQLTGSVPKSLARAEFYTLDLSNNKLTDAFYLFNKSTHGYWEELDLCNNLLKFDFSNADFSNPVFPSQQRGLNISHNMIYGSLPNQLAQLPSGSSVDVSYNQLCGQIPKSTVLEQLSSTNFAHNKCLCGIPLPPCNAPLPPSSFPLPSASKSGLA